jgi:hypothetical protein
LESSHFGAFAASNLFDSTDSTFWESNGNQNRDWVGYQFSSAQTVMQIGLQRHAATMDGSAPPRIVIFQYSDDGMAWATAALADVGTLVNDTPKYFDLTTGLPQSTTTFGSHAYWRMQGFSRSYVACSEIGFKDNTGSTITPSGGTPTEVSHSSTFAVANAFDADNTTFWESGNSTNDAYAWIAYQFTSGKTVMQMSIEQYSGGMDGSLPPTYLWYMYSDDGVVWQVAGARITADIVNDTPLWADFAQAIV